MTERTNREPMLSQPKSQALMLSQAHGGASQRSFLSRELENMKRFYGVCDWCEDHWFDNPVERWAWHIDECTDKCPACGEAMDWYNAAEIEAEKEERMNAVELPDNPCPACDGLGCNDCYMSGEWDCYIAKKSQEMSKSCTS